MSLSLQTIVHYVMHILPNLQQQQRTCSRPSSRRNLGRGIPYNRNDLHCFLRDKHGNRNLSTHPVLQIFVPYFTSNTNTRRRDRGSLKSRSNPHTTCSCPDQTSSMKKMYAMIDKTRRLRHPSPLTQAKRYFYSQRLEEDPLSLPNAHGPINQLHTPHLHRNHAARVVEL
jgi:hypothetical protein